VKISFTAGFITNRQWKCVGENIFCSSEHIHMAIRKLANGIFDLFRQYAMFWC